MSDDSYAHARRVRVRRVDDRMSQLLPVIIEARRCGSTWATVAWMANNSGISPERRRWWTSESIRQFVLRRRATGVPIDYCPPTDVRVRDLRIFQVIRQGRADGLSWAAIANRLDQTPDRPKRGRWWTKRSTMHWWHRALERFPTCLTEGVPR